MFAQNIKKKKKKKKKLVRLPEVYTVDRIIQQRHTPQEQESHEALKRLPEKTDQRSNSSYEIPDCLKLSNYETLVKGQRIILTFIQKMLMYSFNQLYLLV